MIDLDRTYQAIRHAVEHIDAERERDRVPDEAHAFQLAEDAIHFDAEVRATGQLPHAWEGPVRDRIRKELVRNRVRRANGCTANDNQLELPLRSCA